MPPGLLPEEHAATALESKCPDGGSARGSQLRRGGEKDARGREDPLRMRFQCPAATKVVSRGASEPRQRSDCVCVLGCLHPKG